MKKLLPLLTLIIGIIIGYAICQKTSDQPFADFHTKGKLTESLTEKEKAILTAYYKKFAPRFSSPLSVVPTSDALKRIKAYQVKNHQSSYQLLNTAGEEMVGYFIDMNDIKHICNDTRSFDGISIFLATDAGSSSGSAELVYSLVFMGAKLNPNFDSTKPRSLTNSRYTNPYSDNDTFDYLKPCPTYCGNFDQNP
ncbi:MAG TPA: hypothetical protein VIM55_06720 [Mucilaginibacter sp.]